MNVMTKAVGSSRHTTQLKGDRPADRKSKTDKAAKEKPGTKPIATKPADEKPGEVQTSGHPLAGRFWSLEVDHGRIHPSDTNPRTEFDEGGLQELAASITKQGQLQELLVRLCPKWAGARIGKLKAKEQKGKYDQAWEREALEWLIGVKAPEKPKEEQFQTLLVILRDPEAQFELVAGERRWRAMGPKYAAKPKARVTVRCMTDMEVIEAQYHENDKRRQLSVLEEAFGFKLLLDKGLYTHDSLADMLGLSRTKIFGRLKLTRLSGKALDLLKEGKISSSVAEEIAQIPDEKSQARFIRDHLFDYNDQPHPVREIQRAIASHFMRPIKHGGFEPEQSFNYPGAISRTCAECPMNTRNMTKENPEIAKGPARCMNLTCFGVRSEQAQGFIRAKAEADGHEVWSSPDELSGKRFHNAYAWEGEKNGYSQDAKKWEEIAGKVPDVKPIIAITDQGVKRVWRKSELEKAGAFKGESRDGVGPSPAQKKAQREKSHFENLVKEQALVDVMRGLRGYPGGGSGPNFDEIQIAVLRAIVHRDMRYSARQEQDVKKWTAGECLEYLAQLAFKDWFDFGRPPLIVGLLNKDMESVKRRVKDALEDGRKMTSLADLEKAARESKVPTAKAPKEVSTPGQAIGGTPQAFLGELLDRAAAANRQPLPTVQAQ